MPFNGELKKGGRTNGKSYNEDRQSGKLGLCPVDDPAVERDDIDAHSEESKKVRWKSLCIICIGSNFLKYHYKEPDVSVRLYGIEIILDHHPIYSSGTLYLENGRSIIVTQQHFKDKACYWGSVDPGVANSIYLSPNFRDFFIENARELNPPIFQLRKLMWKLRMKPLKREVWEDYF